MEAGSVTPPNPYDRLRRRRLVIRAVILLLIGAAAWRAWTSTRTGDEGFESIDSIVASAMAGGEIAGVSVGVSRGGDVLHAAGYGFSDLENELPATAETAYNIGSITKQFTAAAILLLVEEGRVDLDAPVSEYLEELPDWGEEVTVRRLLQHTAGVKNFTTMERWWRTAPMETTPLELAALISSEPLDFTPGEEFSYSNSGYILLGLLLEKVTDQPYGGLLSEQLFSPLGLPRTSYCDDRTLVRDRARGYELLDGALTNSTHVSISQAYAAGGLCSNLADLLRWTRLLFQGGVITNASLQEMITPGILHSGNPIEYGFGLAIGYRDGHLRIGHVGGMRGFSSYLSHYPEDDLTIAVLTNTEGAAAASIEADIARLLLSLETEQAEEAPLPPEGLERYVGEYTTRLTSVQFSVREGRLHAATPDPGIDDTDLIYRGDDTFEGVDNSEIRIRFEGEGPTALGFVLEYQGIVIRGERVR